MQACTQSLLSTASYLSNPQTHSVSNGAHSGKCKGCIGGS
uniref:Uncharacterized protein n=1 Tax=Anguilla anguilla TaxID=7936 RepID=A0A0E9V7T8_ANGAN